MKLNLLYIKFPDNLISRKDIPKIRGYIASKFPEYIELHHHTDGGFRYQYPLIQYKAIKNIPYLIGVGEGIKILRKIEPELVRLEISGETQKIYEKGIELRETIFGLSNNMHKYYFITPWMALNQKNYRTYLMSKEAERADILKRILIGNIISLSKALGYQVEGQIQAMVNLSPIEVNFKNQKMIAFKGSFFVNFHIPDYLGIGKSVSRGFGSVKQDIKESYQ